MEREPPNSARTKGQSRSCGAGSTTTGDSTRPALAKTLRSIDKYLVRWAMRKYKRLKGRRMRAWAFLEGVFARQPELFAHWRILKATDRTVGAV